MTPDEKLQFLQKHQLHVIWHDPEETDPEQFCELVCYGPIPFSEDDSHGVCWNGFGATLDEAIENAQVWFRYGDGPCEPEQNRATLPLSVPPQARPGQS